MFKHTIQTGMIKITRICATITRKKHNLAEISQVYIKIFKISVYLVRFLWNFQFHETKSLSFTGNLLSEQCWKVAKS